MSRSGLRCAITAAVIGAALVLPTSGSGGPVPEGDPPVEAVLAFDRLVAFAAPLCRARPAETCIDAGFRFVDENGDEALSLAELQRVRDALEEWTSWRGARLDQDERAGIAFGLALTDAVGLEQLVASYDQDGDGRVGRAELLADLRLDERPIRDLLLDPAAVDRAAVARRLGHLAPLLDLAFR